VVSAEHRAFFTAAVAWSRSRDDAHAERMLRSPLCGVPTQIGAAYAALASREGSLTSLLEQERLQVRPEERGAILSFTATLRRLADLPQAIAPEEREAIVLAAFDLYSSCREETADDELDVLGEDFSLLDPASPEPADGVRTNHPRFSASQLNTYVECARKWFYRYLCAAVEDKGSSASYYGTAFHTALENFHAEYPEPGCVDPQELQRKLLGYLNASFDRHRNNFGTPVEHELQLRRARRTGEKYVRWLVTEARRAPFTVVGCEVSAELQLEGFDFIGYIDRLDRDNASGTVAVIDYKTGSIAVSAAEYREKVRRFKDFQLPFYYWARTAQGDRVSRLALIPLKDALLDVRPISLEVIPVPRETVRSASPTGVIPIGELEAARQRMVELCRELTSGESTAFPVTSDASACTYCAYALACVDRPYPVEDRFAR
jgi:RecB family exonuclease